MELKTALVTGASGAIGKAIAGGIASNPEYKVVLLGRDRYRAERDAKDVRERTGNSHVTSAVVDISDKDQIYDLAGSWEGPLHVLVNNAAATPRSIMHTKSGIELQWATNVLGYFWMMLAFEEILKKSAPARIVNVASYWAGGLDLDDPEFKKRRYNNDVAYRQSKQANRMLTVAFAERLKPYNISANSCHPGDVNSKLSNNLGFGGSQSPDEGARTPVWLACGQEGGQITGRYFEHKREVQCQFSNNKQAISRLMELCEKY